MEDASDDKDPIGTIVGIIFLGICTICITYSFVTEYYSQKLVEKSYGKAVGRIEKYFDRHNSDAGSGRTITYSYRVGERTYFRKVDTHVLFPECDKTLTDACLEKRFWVIFSTQDTSKSLINLKLEIHEDSLASFPESIENFE